MLSRGIRGLSRGAAINGNRHKLRLLYWVLCACQLVVTGMGLALAFQVETSYSQNIDYEKSVNSEHRAVDELEIYARAASPQTLALDDDSSDPTQLSQINYASGIFLRKAQALLGAELLSSTGRSGRGFGESGDGQGRDKR